MIQMLRKEACSGAIADLSHVRTEHCLSDSLTKKSANPKNFWMLLGADGSRNLMHIHLSGQCWNTKHF